MTLYDIVKNLGGLEILILPDVPMLIKLEVKMGEGCPNAVAYFKSTEHVKVFTKFIEELIAHVKQKTLEEEKIK